MAAFRSRIELWAQSAGLLATAWVVWAIAIAPYRGASAYLLFRITWAIWIAFCALAWSALIGMTLWLVTRHLNGDEAPPTTMRTFTAAVLWFAPATILLLQFSPTGVAAGLALIVSAARLLCAPTWTRDSETEQMAVRMLTEMEPPLDPLSRHRALALLISIGFQVAGMALLTGHPLPAAALLAMSAALLTSVAIGIGAWVENRPPNLPRSILGLALTFLLALLVGRGGSGGTGWGFGSGSGIGSIANAFRPASGQGDRPEKPAEPPNDLPGRYAGVIIWPEIKPVTVLVAPPLRGKGSGFARQSQPLTIPFGGEYWMFRWPYHRPPPNSYFRRGTPSALSFSTPDHFPMQMEARQKLEQSISLRCCSRLQLAILNADPSPQTIWLELMLLDGNLPKAAAQSLGRAPITSVPRPKETVAETLDFPFPPAPHLDEFDEIKVIFHRAIGRMDRSARVSIERFVLIPPG